ncbi:hypothetical protein LSAT2_007087 [Lamellibrachia satsuma]|nr:hypothetical protein LSAT2_007087 [Lamellibrachia satsuma]
MIEVYKHLHGIYKVDKMPLQMDHNTVTRGHGLKLKKERVTPRQRRSYFRHRVVNRWNSLTEDVSEFTYHLSPGMVIAARCTKIAKTSSKPQSMCWPRGL